MKSVLKSVSQDKPADLPFRPWNPAPVNSQKRPGPEPPEALLRLVTQGDRPTINSLADVPADSLSTRDVMTTMHRPRSICHDVGQFDWLPQLEKAFLLRLSNGFIGDNVVFDNDRYYAFGRWWMGNSSKLYAKTRSIVHVDAGISIAAWGGEAFQHFIMDALPTLAGVIDLLESPGFEHVRIVSHNEGSPMAQWFWRKLRLSDRIVQKPLNAKEGFVVHADEVLYSQYMPTLGEIGLYPRHLLRPIQRRLGLLDPGPQDRVIYLQRPGNFSRTVANEDELLARIRQVLDRTELELEIFTGPKQVIQEDMDRFRRAKIIIGAHGGAMANMIFAQPGSHVIEFLPIYRLYRQGQDSRAMLWGLSQAAGLDYWTVEPDNFAYEEPEGMLVDVEEVVAIVRHLLKA